MTFAKTYLLFILSIFSYASFAQGNKNISISFIENDNIASINIDEPQFITAISSLVGVTQAIFDQYPDSNKVLIFITFHKDSELTSEIIAKPEINQNDAERFYAALDTINFPNTKIVDFPILITVNVDGGMNNEAIQQFLPPYQRINSFKNADFYNQLEFIRQWATLKALPVIQAYEQKVDEKFEGVLLLGNALSEIDYSKPIDIESLTSKNPNYWRAMMEMSKGNILIPMTKIALLASQDKLDYARKYAEIFGVFSKKGGVPDTYLKDFNFYLSIFNESLSEKVTIAIELHDDQKYEASIAELDRLLAVYPSAWAMHEKYLSQLSLSLTQNDAADQSKTLWNEARKEIFKINPLYGYELQMGNQKEAYSFYLRQEISKLFASNDNLMKDLYSYADIALKLEDYDFAAHIYWQLFLNDKGNTLGLNRFLYCLEKLGVTELKKNFKGDFKKEFNSIDKQLNSDFKNNDFIQNFKE